MSNDIHPTAIIDSGVRLGSGNTVGPYCVITGAVAIGDGNWFGPHCVIGTPAMFSTRKFELNGQGTSGITIGSRNVIREYTNVNQPSRDVTAIEDDCYIMAYNYISHDTVIRSKAVMANNCQLAGFTEIGFGVNLGLSVAVHQFSTIGAFAMVGMGSVVGKDVPPFSKVVGNPLTLLGVNEIGMERNGFDQAYVNEVKSAYASGDISVLKGSSPHVEAFLARNAVTQRRVLAIKLR